MTALLEDRASVLRSSFFPTGPPGISVSNLHQGNRGIRFDTVNDEAPTIDVDQRPSGQGGGHVALVGEAASLVFLREFRRLQDRLTPLPPGERLDGLDGARAVLAALNAPDLDDLAGLVDDLEATLEAIAPELGAEAAAEWVALESREWRRFLVEGELQAILLRYRDEQAFLHDQTLAEGLAALARGLAQLQAGARRLNGQLLVELSFEPEVWKRNLAAFHDIEAAVTRYQATLGGEKTGTLSGRMDVGKVWREFVAACALVLLRHYGFVTPSQIRRLVGMKSSVYLLQYEQASDDGRRGIERRINDVLAPVRKTALGSARREAWSSLPMLALFSSQAKRMAALASRVEQDRHALAQDRQLGSDLQSVWR